MSCRRRAVRRRSVPNSGPRRPRPARRCGNRRQRALRRRRGRGRQWGPACLPSFHRQPGRTGPLSSLEKAPSSVRSQRGHDERAISAHANVLSEVERRNGVALTRAKSGRPDGQVTSRQRSGASSSSSPTAARSCGPGCHDDEVARGGRARTIREGPDLSEMDVQSRSSRKQRPGDATGVARRADAWRGRHFTGRSGLSTSIRCAIPPG